jgi:3D (Asp-Asp-Asp) domain-containing protein
LYPLKRLIGLAMFVMLASCTTLESTNIVLQQSQENAFLTGNDTVPYTIVEVTEYEVVAAQKVVELPYASSRAGYTWLISKVKSGSPSQLAVTYRVTYDLDGNILSKVKIPGSEKLIQAIPVTYQYGAKVTKGAYFYARTISRYGFDCVGCEAPGATTATTASLLKVSATAVRQSDGTWKDGITYDGYYIVAADKAFPLCTVLEISNHHFSGSGIKVGVPFKVLVADRGGAITTNRLDFFIGTESYLNTVIHNANSKGTKVTVVGFLKWKRNSLGQMTCVK